MKTTILIITTFALLYYGIVWDTERIIVQPCTACVATNDIKNTIKDFGYNREYRILEDGTLQVYIRGQWLRLRIKH